MMEITDLCSIFEVKIQIIQIVKFRGIQSVNLIFKNDRKLISDYFVCFQ